MPVFILAVFVTTLIVDHVRDDKRAVNRLIISEGILLILAGLTSWFFRYENTNSILKDFVPMLVVFALGLQNAGGRIFAKEVLAPTTVMTGNVTQVILDLTSYLKNRNQEKQELKLKIVHTLFVILPFLIGCISGGLITKAVGLGSTVFIGLLLLLLIKNKNVSLKSITP